MLVLTRKLDEAIIIGDNIEIKILQVRGSGDTVQVRIGISAPQGVPVLRKEIYGQVKEENLRAARQGATSSARRVTTMFNSAEKKREAPAKPIEVGDKE